VKSSRALLLLGFALAFVLLLVLYGVVPGSSSSNRDFFSETHARCVGESLGLGRPWCRHLGVPFGAPLFTEGPVLALAGALGSVVGFALGYDLVMALVLAVALLSAYGLLRRLGASSWLALAASTAYLLSPTVLGMEPFPGTAEGFQLLPAFALADLLVMREVERRSGWALAAVFAAYAALRSLTLFLDGYAFFTSALVGLALWVAWAWRSEATTRRKLLGGSMYVGAGAVAGLLYVSYVPEGFGAVSLEAYRGLGLDVVTLLVPSNRVGLGSLLGLGSLHEQLWGDGSNAFYNYVGPVVGVLAVVGLVRFRSDSRVLALAAAGALALVLSFGPSLKVDETVPRGTPAAANPYLAPAGTGVSLPWGGLYDAVPGLDSMRASYRWFGVTRMALVLLAALGVTALLRSRRLRLVGLALGVLALLETAPAVPKLVELHEDLGERRELVRRDLVGPLRTDTRPGEQVFYLQAEGPANQFLSDYLTTEAGLDSSNVGGDKNGVAAQQRWPPAIRALARRGDRREAVVAALGSGEVDAVVVPLFKLSAYSFDWPPPRSERFLPRRRFAGLFADKRLSAKEHEWFVILRARHAAAARRPAG
jgi:hypothetical protein